MVHKWTGVARLVNILELADTFSLCYFVCRILNKLTPEKFDLLKGQLIDSGITTADILKVSALQSLMCHCSWVDRLVLLLHDSLA